MVRYITLLLFIVLAFAQEKTLSLKSGDKITGTVVSETDTTITISSTIVGEITINKDNLKQELISITLNSGDVIKGVVIEKTSSYFKIQAAFGDITIQSDDIKTIKSFSRNEAENKASLMPKRTLFGTRREQTGDVGTGEWYFSKERLMDIWFDPTGYTIERNKLYFSGLSWGLGLTDHIQITSKWINYFWQDFNLRPKINLFKTGNVDSQISLAAGGHLHTRGRPGKFKWVDTDDAWREGKYVRLGATRNGDELSDDGDNWDDDFEDGDKMWFEVFCAITSSKIRNGGNGRFNTTLGTSAVIYPNEDIAPRIYIATDIDISESVKVMGEIFYDEYYPEIINLDRDTKMNSPIHFDIGFLTNKIGPDDRLWVGVHFQRPFVVFYWKF